MRLRSVVVCVLVVLSFATGSQAFAQAVVRTDVPEIVTDRPDFTESSEVIPAGWLQLESGVSFEGESTARAFSAPAALLRIGLGHRTELRLGAEGLLSEAVGGVRHSGRSDMEVGAKVKLFDQATRGFDFALLPIVSLPTGTSGFTSGGVDPTLKITWGRDLPAGFGLTGNVNASSLTEDGTRFHQEAMSLSVGHDLFFGFGGYAEVYGFTKMSATDGAGVTVNGGVSRLLGRHVQFDVEAGRGLTSASPDWFVGFGFAVIAPQPRR
jgi:hypothetical protein